MGYGNTPTSWYFFEFSDMYIRTCSTNGESHCIGIVGEWGKEKTKETKRNSFYFYFSKLMGQSQIENTVVSTFFITEFYHTKVTRVSHTVFHERT